MPQASKHLFAGWLTILLGGCFAPSPVELHPVTCPTTECPACPACAPCPKCPEAPAARTPAAAATDGPATLRPAVWSDLPGIADDALAEALPALAASCDKLAGQPRWREFCGSLTALPAGAGRRELAAVLRSGLVPWQVVNADGSESGLVTGYYEPLIHGRLVRDAQAHWPIHGVPDDLVSVELADVYPELEKLRLRGRLVGGVLEPYWTRAEIMALGDALPAPVLLWADDPIELFFLQVQGSGRVQLPDGSLVRIGYANHNGHPYVSIGRWLIEQGEMTLSDASMAGIKAWARAHPQRLEELLGVNPGYVFFRQLPAGDGGPLGALGVALTAGRSIAVDPRSVPLGAPVLLDTTEPASQTPLRRLVVAQDTGGAIKGGVRADFFWGFGAEAGAMAGRMRQQGRMWVLLPPDYEPEATPAR
ncbi:MAG: MltA domain-containing protein [Zoogloeaceae bacterium]|nr:MltA domain-containing protein [Rhodocyclaceae bacterium]MCP5234677.1 MltA domain-containing protein [Zoogloeaceae bacterium]